MCENCIHKDIFFSFFSVKNASANISVDTTAGEICFYSSPQECSLTQLTQYNVSITDLTRNLIFMKEMIPETSCVNIQAILHRQCYPYFMSIQPLNNFITYNSIHQLIEGMCICFCIYHINSVDYVQMMLAAHP